MTEKIELSHSNVQSLCRALGNRMLAAARGRNPLRIFPIPRGGVPVAYALAAIHGMVVVDEPGSADCYVDDIIDSGETRATWTAKGGTIHLPFYAIIDKTDSDCLFRDKWVVFPWEKNEATEGTGIEDNIRRLLQFIGEDPKRGGLLETPGRVAKAWSHWSSGYATDIPALLKTFEDGADGCDEMVVVKNIPFYTHCEHHMAPFFGRATVAYIPSGKIVGLSKLSRVVDAFARRLQVQERLTNQIADALAEHLQPKGVGVIITARHLCMESRGVQQQGHETVTSALRGVMRDKPEARAEFLTLR